MSAGWSEIVSGRKARLITIALLALQLGGCVADLMSEQMALMPVFCLVAPGHGLLELLGFVLWLVLSLSWVAGLMALQLTGLRPFYWGLVLLIPIAYALHAWLLHRQLFFCDGP